jgi:hypothetical protein
MRNGEATPRGGDTIAAGERMNKIYYELPMPGNNFDEALCP